MLGAATLAAAWAWSPRHGWNPLDLRTLGWTLAVEDSLPLQSLAVGLPLLLLAGALLTARLRGRRRNETPWRVAAWTAPVLAVPLMAFTATVLAADALETDGWTLTRQNLDTLRGDLGCGLADHELVADRSTLRALPVAASQGPVEGRPPFVLDLLGPGGIDRTPWLRLPADRRYGLVVFSALPIGDDERLVVESGRSTGMEVDRLGGTALRPDVVEEVYSDTSTQHFFGPSEVPRPHPQANVIRIVRVEGAERDGSPLVTAPVTFAPKPLVDELRPEESRSLVLPPIVPYLPCVQLPRLGNGVVEVPSHIVSADIEFTPLGNATSPFVGLFDIYPIERLPWADAEGAPDEITVFRVDRRIQGAKLAPPDRDTQVS